MSLAIFERFSAVEAIAAILLIIGAVGTAYKIVKEFYKPELLGGFDLGQPSPAKDSHPEHGNRTLPPSRLGGCDLGQKKRAALPSRPSSFGKGLKRPSVRDFVFSIDSGDNVDPWAELEAFEQLSLLSQEAIAISRGHAYAEHLFDFPGITNQDELAVLIDSVMNGALSEVKELTDERTAYWDDESETLVITDPDNLDGGTVFKPENGREYFDNLE